MAASHCESQVGSLPVPALTDSEIKLQKTWVFYPLAQLGGVL